MQDSRDEGQGRDVERVLAAERDARRQVDASRDEARRILEDARAQARRIASRAEDRVSAMHRRTTERIAEQRQAIEQEGEARVAAVETALPDTETLQRAAERVAAELTQAETETEADADAGSAS